MSKATQTPYELQLARRMSRLGTETAFEVLNKARALERQGRNIIHLEIGEPDFDTPANVVEAAVDALHSGWTHYGPSAGLPDPRQALAEYVSRTRGVKVRSDEVVVVPGGKPIIFFSILALVDEGDEVIYPTPGFPIYESMINYVGGRAVPIALREERDFSLDVKELVSLISDRTKLIIINSPQNPTGGVLERRDIEQIAKVIGERKIMILSDEIYSRLLFDGGQHFSIMSVPGMQERTILLDGFSKTYAMTGWRMGYGVMRADLAAHMTRLMTNSNSCTASFTQVAGIEAIRGDQSSVDHMRDEFQRRRDVFVAGLNKIKGFSCRMPKGAFYVFPNITATGWKSKPLADALLEQAGSGAVRDSVRGIRRRISAIQCGEFAGESKGSGPTRAMDEEEESISSNTPGCVLGSCMPMKKSAESTYSQTQPSAGAGVRFSRSQQGPAAVVVGRAAAEEVA
jgi:aspartate/methionine/tyrosine aminotransferase